MKAEEFTKYEKARILGARALQISMDAPMLIKIDKEELEKINYDPLRIAEIEFSSGVLPITVKRPLPKRIEKKIKKKEEEKPVEKKEEKAKVTGKEAPKAEDEKVEKKEVTAEKEIKEGGEIMELAQPEDELEDAEPREEPGVED